MINEAGKQNDLKWWNNPAVMGNFEKEYKAWEAGKEKGQGWVELKTEIARRKPEKRQRNKKSTKQ